MEDYLRQVLDQIRCKRAHVAIREELENHICDQKEDYMEAGMTAEEAEKAAVCDMGDPVSTGISLDKIHRPKAAWQMILLMTVIFLAALFIQWQTGGSSGSCVQMIAGFGVMLLVYHFDYTRIAAGAKIIALGFIVFGLFSIFYGTAAGGAIRSVSLPGGMEFSICAVLMLYVPVYGAVLYSYYGTGYKGLLKAVLWAVPPVLTAFYLPSLTFVLILSVCMASLLILAVAKGWFHVSKKKVLIVSGASVVLLPVLLLFTVVRAPYQFDRIRQLFLGEPGYISQTLRQCFTDSIFLGNGVGEIEGILPDCKSSFILAYLTGTYGYLACIGVCAVLALLMFAIFSAVFRQKNQLGLMMGFGSGLIIGVNLLINLLENFGVLPVSQTFLPFFSQGGSYLFVCYMLMGIILSVYRYKDVYSFHVPGKMRAEKA